MEEVVYLLKRLGNDANITGIEDRQSRDVTLCWRDKEKVDCCSRQQTSDHAGCGTVGAQLSVLSAQVLRVASANERPELTAPDQSEDGQQTILRQS